MTLEQKHLLGGEWVDDRTHVFESVSPVTGRVLWKGPAAGVDQISQAVMAARGAFCDWRRLSFAERVSYVLRFIDRIEAQRDELAMVIHEETGKPLWESKTEIATMIAKAAVSKKAYEERTGQHDAEFGGVQLALSHRPIGVLDPFLGLFLVSCFPLTLFLLASAREKGGSLGPWFPKIDTRESTFLPCIG